MSAVALFGFKRPEPTNSIIWHVSFTDPRLNGTMSLLSPRYSVTRHITSYVGRLKLRHSLILWHKLGFGGDLGTSTCPIQDGIELSSPSKAYSVGCASVCQPAIVISHSGPAHGSADSPHCRSPTGRLCEEDGSDCVAHDGNRWGLLFTLSAC